MNKKAHTQRYLLFDFLSAGLAWVLFNFFRKAFIESSVYDAEIKLEYSSNLVISTTLVGLFWVLLYYFSGYYYNIYRKYRLQEFSHTIVFSIIGVVFLFLPSCLMM
jgi:small-conductance mechanosensitive channel